MRLKNKIVVTAAAQGIGSNSSYVCKRRSAVIATDINEKKLKISKEVMK